MFGRVASAWPARPADVRWGVPAVLLGLFGTQLLAVVWIVLAAGVLYGSDPLPAADERPIWTLLLFNLGLWSGYLGAPILARRTSSSAASGDFDLRVTPKQAGLAALVGVGAQLVVLPALYWPLLRIFDQDPGRSAQDLADRVNGPLDVLLFVLAVVVVAPVVEEWFYRGMMLPTLARFFGWKPAAGDRTDAATRMSIAAAAVIAAVISSAVFALVHQELILLPGLFVLALLLSWLTVITGRLGPAIVAHMAFNATTVVQLLVFGTS